MTERLILEIIDGMKDKLSLQQTEQLKVTLYVKLKNYAIEFLPDIKMTDEKDFEYYQNRYLNERENEGLSKGTIENYRLHLSLMLTKINKNVKDITDNDLLLYFKEYKEERNISNGYLNDIRHVFNSFFIWMQYKRFIVINPIQSIRPFREIKKIKKPFSGEQMECLRSHCESERDLAMLEVLYSSAMRVSELCYLNRADINFSSNDVIIFGKGGKERETYLNPKAFYHLKNYLASRDDDNEALFVGIRAPHKRLTRAGIEAIFRKIGRLCGVEQVDRKSVV